MKLAYVGLVAAVVVSVLVGVWIIFFTPEVAAPVVDTSVPAVPAAATDERSGRATLASFLDSSEPIECAFVFTDVETATQGEGTGFFADGQMRVDALYSDETNAQYTSNLIMDETTMYVWASTADGAFALQMPKDMNTLAATDTPATDQTAGALSPNDEVRYTCKPWQVDGSVFVPPASIEFMDMSGMMQQMFEGADFQMGNQ